MNKIKQLLSEEEGLTTVEYAIAGSLVGLTVAVAHHASQRVSRPTISSMPLERKPVPRSSSVALKAAVRGETLSRRGVRAEERAKEHAPLLLPLPSPGLLVSVDGRW